MILLTLSRGKGEETVRLQLPASPAEIGETFAFLDRISLDTTATAILDVSSNVSFMAYDSIEATDGDYVSALFVEPFMGPEYPHIYIAVGDYDVQKKEAGQDNALGGILRSVAHELTHYYQWLNGIKLTETGYELQARYYADVIVGWYSTSYEHP